MMPLALMILTTAAFDLHYFHGQGRMHHDPEDQHVFKRFFSNSGEPPYRFNGTFVEMGAADGISISNSFFFEQQLGWSGMLVEPSSNFARVLQNRWNGGRNTLLHEAVCAETGQVTWAEGANKDVSGVLEHLSSHNLHRYHAHSNRTTITCRPLSEMLASAAIDSIDFFSLDTEGAELAVLETMNWSVPIHVLCVELDGQNKTKDEGVRTLLRSRGYRQHTGRMGFRMSNEIWTQNQTKAHDHAAPPLALKVVQTVLEYG